MTTYTATAPQPAKSGGTDVAAWALVAIVVALICAGAGWAIARNDVMGMDDLSRASDIAARDGLARGEASGYADGARLGRREAAAKAKLQISQERHAGAREGYDAGYQEGRAKAGDPDAYMSAGLPGGAYPAAGYEDILASGLFGGDEPGYSTSAYDSMGYGAGASSPYLGSNTSATSLGDDYLY